MAQLRSVSLFDASGGTWSLSFETVVDPNGTGAVELTAGQGVMIGPLRMARKSPGSHLAARGEQPLGSAGITLRRVHMMYPAGAARATLTAAITVGETIILLAKGNAAPGTPLSAADRTSLICSFVTNAGIGFTVAQPIDNSTWVSIWEQLPKQAPPRSQTGFTTAFMNAVHLSLIHI